MSNCGHNYLYTCTGTTNTQDNHYVSYVYMLIKYCNTPHFTLLQLQEVVYSSIVRVFYLVAWDRMLYCMILHYMALVCPPSAYFAVHWPKILFALQTPDVKLVIWVGSMGNCRSLPMWATVQLTHLLILIFTWAERSQVGALTICKCMAVGCSSATYSDQHSTLPC